MARSWWTNGDFSGGLTGWTEGAGWTIDPDEGVATHSGTAGPLDYVLTGMDTSKTYEVSIQISGSVSGSLAIQLVGGGNVTLYNATAEFGTLRVYGSPLSSTPTLRLYGGTNATYTIDNISVREAPKIVWAPHNLVEYSEDFSQWANIDVVLDSSTAADPLGGITASTYSNFMSATNARSVCQHWDINNWTAASYFQFMAEGHSRRND